MSQAQLSGIELPVRSIIKLSSWIITLPFYIYALIKWHQFNGHFLIQKRFRPLSYAIFIISFFGQTLSLIADWLSFRYSIHDIITYCVLSLTFVISGLVLFRINLVYLKWKLLQNIKPRMSLRDTDNTLSPPRKPNRPSLKPITSNSIGIEQKPFKTEIQTINIYKAPLSISILVFTVIGSIIFYGSYRLSLDFIANTLFFVLFLLIAVSILNIKRKRVKEEIGCISECYAMLILLLIQMILEVGVHEILEYSTFCVLTLQGMVTLYIPLVLLLKYEGTLHLKQYQNTTDEKVFVTDDNMQLSTVNDEIKETGTILFNKCLFQFLYKNQTNHSLFSDYLQLCFAPENLMFVERVSILYQMVLKLQKMEELHDKSSAMSDMATNSPSDKLTLPSHLNLSDSFDIKHSLELTLSTLSDIEVSKLCRVSAISMDMLPHSLQLTPVTPIPNSLHFDLGVANINQQQLKYIYRFEFVYLTDIRDHYLKMMAINEYIGNYNVSVYKEPLYNICRELYDQFIASDSESQVNLSDAVCKRLQYLLCDNRENAPQQFQSYDDFLTLFDGAVIEAYRLMVNVYSYRFKKYVKDKFGDVVFE